MEAMAGSPIELIQDRIDEVATRFIEGEELLSQIIHHANIK